MNPHAHDEASRLATPRPLAATIAGTIATLIFTCMPATAGAWQTIQLTNNDTDDVYPQVSQSLVAWIADDSGTPDIHLYDGHSTTPLTDDGMWNLGVRLSGDHAMWLRYGSPPNEGVGQAIDVIYYDGTSARPINIDPYSNYWPEIRGSQVAWGHWDGNDSEIHYFNGATTVSLTDNNTSETSVALTDAAVYFNSRSPSNSDEEIFRYTAAGLQQITDNDEDEYVAAADGDYVLISRDRPGSYVNDLYLFDGTGETRLTNTDEFELWPVLSGNHAAWYSGGRNIDDEIYLFDGSVVHQLTHNDTDDQYPAIFGDYVVWEGDDGHDTEIFFYDGHEIHQLTDNDEIDYAPRIWGDRIVWMGFDGHDYEVYMTVVPEPATLLLLTPLLALRRRARRRTR